jgi:hypothetical protein
VYSLVQRYRKMLVKFDPPLGELYWDIDKQKPQDYYSFGIISKPKAYTKSPTSIDSEPSKSKLVSARLSSITPQKQRGVLRPSNHIF